MVPPGSLSPPQKSEMSLETQKTRMYNVVAKTVVERIFFEPNIYMDIKNDAVHNTCTRVMSIIFNAIENHVNEFYPDNELLWDPHEQFTDFTHALLHRMFKVFWRFYAKDEYKDYADTMGILFDPDMFHTMYVVSYDYTPEQQFQVVTEILDMITTSDNEATIEFLKAVCKCMAFRNWTDFLPEDLETLREFINQWSHSDVRGDKFVAALDEMSLKIGTRLTAVGMLTM
jgi:hypothetical protein